MKYKKALKREEDYWLMKLGIDCFNNNTKEMEVDKIALEAIRLIYARKFSSDCGTNTVIEE